MCLVALAFQTVPDLTTVIAANRDEFHARRTEPLHAWPDFPEVLAGRDGRAGGTWMGLTATGRYAFVTNYRDPTQHRPAARTRGELVADFLTGSRSPEAYMRHISRRGGQYSGFNLIVGTPQYAWYYSNMGAAPHALGPGVYLLSNHLLDSPWPKTQRIRDAFQTELSRHSPSADDTAQAAVLTQMMFDTALAPDGDLPDTGLPLARERMLSSAFIISPDYGTRSTAVAVLNPEGGAWVAETRYDTQGRSVGATLVRSPKTRT